MMDILVATRSFLLYLLIRVGKLPELSLLSFLNCLARELVRLSRSSDFYSKVENIFLIFSNTAVLALALTSEIFAAAVV